MNNSNVVAEAHCYALQSRQIDCEQIHSSFSHEGLHQLRTKKICMQLMKAFVAKASCNQLLIDSATYVFAHNQFAYMNNSVAIMYACM